MALVLTGIVTGMRPVGGVVSQGSRKGETWEFLSMEISDPRFAKLYSCQLRSTDKQFKEFADEKVVKDEHGNQVKKYTLKDGKDLTGRKVKVTIASITAGERVIEDKETGKETTILQIRTQITNIRDLGEAEEEE